MEQHNRNTQLTRETAWWFIPKEHVTALRKLEDRLNDLVYTNGILSREEALETLKNELSRKDRENAKKILDHFIRFYEKSNNILNVTEGNGLVLRIKCELVGTYSEDFANARIIFEKLLLLSAKQKSIEPNFLKSRSWVNFLIWTSPLVNFHCFLAVIQRPPQALFPSHSMDY